MGGPGVKDYTFFDVDMNVTEISESRRDAHYLLEKKGYTLQNLREFKVGGHIPTYLHTLALGLEYLLSNHLYYDLPKATEAFVEEVASLKDRLPSRQAYVKTGTSTYKKDGYTTPDTQYKAQMQSNMRRARMKLQKIFDAGVKYQAILEKEKLDPKS